MQSWTSRAVSYATETKAICDYSVYDDISGDRVAIVRMARKTQIDSSSGTPVEVAVSAQDGDQGIFIPTVYIGSVLLAPTVTTVCSGRA